MPGSVHKLLIVDNFDSFTYNIAQCVSQVTGERPVVLRNDEIGWDEIAAAGFDRIIISPGPGTPENETDFGVSRDVLHKAEVPVLGVCLGHQGIGLEFGARVIHAPSRSTAGSGGSGTMATFCSRASPRLSRRRVTTR